MYDYGYAFGEDGILPDYIPFEITKAPFGVQVGLGQSGGFDIENAINVAEKVYDVSQRIYGAYNVYKSMEHAYNKAGEMFSSLTGNMETPQPQQTGNMEIPNVNKIVPSTSDKTPVFTTGKNELPGDELLTKMEKKFKQIKNVSNKRIASSMLSALQNSEEYQKYLKYKNDKQKEKQMKSKLKKANNSKSSGIKWKLFKGAAAVLGVALALKYYPKLAQFIRNNPQRLAIMAPPQRRAIGAPPQRRAIGAPRQRRAIGRQPQQLNQQAHLPYSWNYPPQPPRFELSPRRMSEEQEYAINERILGTTIPPRQGPPIPMSYPGYNNSTNNNSTGIRSGYIRNKRTGDQSKRLRGGGKKKYKKPLKKKYKKPLKPLRKYLKQRKIKNIIDKLI